MPPMNRLLCSNSITVLLVLSFFWGFGSETSSSEIEDATLVGNEGMMDTKTHSENVEEGYMNMLHDCQTIVSCPLCVVPAILDQTQLSRILPSSRVPFLSAEAQAEIIRMLSFGPNASPFFPFWIQYLNIDFVQASRDVTNLEFAETLAIWHQAFPLCPDIVSVATRIIYDQQYDIRVQLTAFLIMYELPSTSEIISLSKEIVERHNNARSFHPYLENAAWTVLFYIGDEDGF